MADTMLSHALALAARGWPVFPCDPRPDPPGTPAAKKRAKRPLVPGADRDADGHQVPKTGGLWRATTDAAQIRRWWQRSPLALIGVPTGPKIGAFVVDLDPKDETVDETEARLVDAVGALPTGPRSRTQSGGLHLWFRLPDGEIPKNSAKRIRNVDWRGDGGYVIVPPSVMLDGAAYSWIVSPDEVPLPEAPAQLLDLVFQRGTFARHADVAAPAHAPRRASADDAGERAVRLYARAALDRAARDVAGAGKGARGHTLNAAAYGIAPLVGCGVLSEREVTAALQDAADACGLTAEDGSAERDAKIRRGLAANIGNTGAMSRRIDEIREDARRKAASRRPPPPSSIDDYYATRDGGAVSDGAPRTPSDDEVAPQTADDDGEPGTGPRDGGRVDMAVVAECALLDHSDTDNAERLLKHFGADLLVLAQTRARAAAYAVWTGTHWDIDTGGPRALAIAQQVGGRIALECAALKMTEAEQKIVDKAKALADKDEASLSPLEKRVVKQALEATGAYRKRVQRRMTHAVSSKNKGRLEAMLACAAPHIMRAPDEFNADPLKVALADCTLVFSRTVKRVENPDWSDPDISREDVPRYIEAVVPAFKVAKGHRREDLITQLVPVRYDRKATCPRFLAFVEDKLPIAAVRRMVQVAVGLGLVGLTVQKLFFHWGKGANGKSVFMETICRLLGDTAVTLPSESFTGEAKAGGAANPDMARLYGRRLLRVKELPEGEDLREALVKDLTGGEHFTARDLFQGYFDFKPIFTGHMSGNGYPKITGGDEGIWRRMAVVLWSKVIAVEDQREFEEVMADFVPEYPGILNWLIEGVMIFLREGLVVPPEVLEQTLKYRSAMDPTSAFCSRCIVTDANGEVTAKEFYTAYCNFTVDQGGKPISLTRFGLIMQKKYERVDGRIVVYRGFRLVDVPRASGDHPPPPDPDDYGS